jgi:hypothetical protein
MLRELVIRAPLRSILVDTMSETTELIGALATAGAAVVAGVYTILTYRLLKVTASGVEIAQRTFSSSHRPYVGITEANLSTRAATEAIFLIRLQNFGTVPARDVTIEVKVRIADDLFAEHRSKQFTTLFPQVLNHYFGMPLSGDQLRPFTTMLAGERMDIEIRVEYVGLADVRFETFSHYHRNSQDSGFLEDLVIST